MHLVVGEWRYAAGDDVAGAHELLMVAGGGGLLRPGAPEVGVDGGEAACPQSPNKLGFASDLVGSIGVDLRFLSPRGGGEVVEVLEVGLLVVVGQGDEFPTFIWPWCIFMVLLLLDGHGG